MTSATDPKTIELYGYGCQHEALALGAITPGMLVERAAGGVQVHSTPGENANPHFANEFGMTGETIDDAYAADDQVIFTTYSPGSGVYAWLADTENVTEGAFLASDGAGALAAAGDDEVVVAQALESVNNTGGGSGPAEAARIRVEIVSPQRTAPAT